MATVRFAVPRPAAAVAPPRPPRPPRAPAAAALPQPLGAGRLALLFAPLVAVTWLAQLSVPPLAAHGLGLDVAVILAATLLGLAAGSFEVHRTRLMAYLALVAWIGGVQLVLGRAFAPASVLWLGLWLLPLVLQMRGAGSGAADARTAAPEAPLQRGLDALATAAAFFAACGLLQFVLQRWVGTAAAFPLEHLLPPAWRVDGFDTLVPVVDGVETLKPTGVFLPGPALFGQFVALGLLAELSTRRRLTRVALLATALAAAFSASALLVAAAGVIALVLAARRFELLFVATLLLPVLLLALGDASPWRPWLDRAGELEPARAGGRSQLVLWLDLFRLQWWADPLRVLFGAGAGSFAGHAELAGQPSAQLSLAKVLFEYGLTGAAFFFGFLVHAFNGARVAPLAVRVGLCSMLLVNAALVPLVVGIAASVLLWPGAGRSGARGTKRGA